MESPDLARLITTFFVTHLAAERNVSRNTEVAYRDALKLFLRFASDFYKCKVDSLVIEQLTVDVVLGFLHSLLSPTIFDFAGLGLFGIAEATDGV